MIFALPELFTDRPARSPEHDLLCAVLRLAVHDFFAKRPRKNVVSQYDSRPFDLVVRDWIYGKRSAEQFLFGPRDQSSFEHFCGLLGFDPDVLREGIRKRQLWEEKRRAA